MLHDNSLNLLVIKSKYGFIAGFFKTNINDVTAIAINGQNRLIPMIMDSDKTSIYVSDGASVAVKSSIMTRSNSDEMCLVQYCPAGTDYIPEGIYINQCAGVKSCAVYTVGSGSEKFAELSSADGYISFALKLEEPTEADYEGIKPLRSAE